MALLRHVLEYVPFLYCVLILAITPRIWTLEVDYNGIEVDYQHVQPEDDENSFRQFRQYMNQARTNDGVIDLNSLLQENVVDPVLVADFNVSTNGMLTDIYGQFTNVELHGLRNFEITKLKINLSRMNLSASMYIPTLTVTGDYVLGGSMLLMQISGDGAFWMNLSRISIEGQSQFYSKSLTSLEMDDIKLESEVGDIKLHFENLMGGGTWSRFSNTLLNQLSELILDELKHSLLAELAKFVKTEFNDHLFKNLPPGFIDPKSISVVDSLLHKVSELIMDNGLDPLELPDLEKKFERRVLFMTTHGELKLSNGYLFGLSSLKRKGDVIIAFENDSIVLEADFGFDNLTGKYDFETKVFGVGPEGTVEITIKAVQGFMGLRQELRTDSRLNLSSFHIHDIKHIWLDVSGLGSWDYIMEIVANLATNGLKMQLVDLITGPVKESMQKELNSLNSSWYEYS